MAVLSVYVVEHSCLVLQIKSVVNYLFVTLLQKVEGNVFLFLDDGMYLSRFTPRNSTTFQLDILYF